MKLCAISAILIAGAFLLLTTTIDQTAAYTTCDNCKIGEVACYENSENDPEPDPTKCCCAPKCAKIEALGAFRTRECSRDPAAPTGCIGNWFIRMCYCETYFCNSASSLLPAGILVVMTTVVLCLIVWPTINIH